MLEWPLEALNSCLILGSNRLFSQKHATEIEDLRQPTLSLVLSPILASAIRKTKAQVTHSSTKFEFILNLLYNHITYVYINLYIYIYILLEQSVFYRNCKQWAPVFQLFLCLYWLKKQNQKTYTCCREKIMNIDNKFKTVENKSMLLTLFI